jgi:four helix bundle protein
VARHYTEIVAWLLGDEIRRMVFRWTERARFAQDLKARSQIEDAANSICRNIAEGFSGSHGEFARYLAIARRSLNELRDCTHAAELKRYIDRNEAAEFHALARRAYLAISGLIRYLSQTPDPPRTGGPPSDRPSRPIEAAASRSRRRRRE